MITIISGTNRQDSKTLKIATHYYNLLKKQHIDVHMLSLLNLEVHFRSDELKKIEEELLIPTEKFIIVIPEYNGSYPGIFKTMIDNTDIRKCWWYKKALLVGVADGRGGNLRGLDDLSNVLHYLRVNVFYNKLPISKINEELDADGLLQSDLLQTAIGQQVNGFLEF